jgi:hypothetical protein
MKHKTRAAALVLSLALLLLAPAAALAVDATAPVATLYSPTVNAAVSSHQKIIFSLTERVSLASEKAITVTGAGVTYTAAATSGTLIGNQATGPWYVVYDLGDFLDGATPLTLANNTTYDVAAVAGAFLDAASNPSGEVLAHFTTVSSGAVIDPIAVVYTITNANQSVTSGVDPVMSGQAVQNGTQVAFSIPADPGYVLVKTVKVNGSTVMGANLSSYTLAGDLEVYYARTDGTLSGTVTIQGNAYFGETLTAALTNCNQPDTSGLIFKFVRQDGENNTELVTGGTSISYELQEADIGKIIRLDVTDGTLTGTLSASTVAIAKEPYSGDPATPPVVQSTTDTSITLQTVSEYEYMRDGGEWQDSTTFDGLTAGTDYVFFQRVKATATMQPSATSAGATIATKEVLVGTVNFSSAAQSEKELTVTLSGSNASGTVSYLWKRGDTTVGMAASYTPDSGDIGQALTLVITTSDQTGSISGTTAAVLKAENPAVPAAPTLASKTATSITLTTHDGYLYSLGGTSWQNTPGFHNLTPGTAYTFYQRVAETDTTLASASSAGASFSTEAALTGTIMSIGEARYGITISVNLTGSNNTGTLTYTWKRGTIPVGSGTSYAVQSVDIGNQLSVEVTSTVQGGSVTRSFGTVQKAYFVGDPPAAPTRYSRTTSKIVLNTVDGCEYSRGGTSWQDSTTFSGLSDGTSYTFYQRYKATATTEASEKSAAYKTSTTTYSSDGTTATPTPSATNSSGGTALYTYTLTDDNTRILYSTMKSLAEGNKTQDVTIKQSNVEFTFPKGTMTDVYTQLWYDFGTTINNSIAEQTAKQIAGDAYVATIHFNYNGELPGEANIRFWLGAAQAGKTLYYYLLNADNTLTFMQTASVDTSGWVSVTQTHCSDYVFLDRDVESASASPSPSPTASASVSPEPTPTSEPAAGAGGIMKDGWFIAAIVLIAVALIVGGIWLYTKNRDSRYDDDDDL